MVGEGEIVVAEEEDGVVVVVVVETEASLPEAVEASLLVAVDEGVIEEAPEGVAGGEVAVGAEVRIDRKLISGNNTKLVRG